MANEKIISETPMTMAEVKEELARIRKRDENLNFRAEKTEEYLGQFKVLGEKDAKDLYKKIEALEIPRFRPEHIVKVIDLLPTTADEVRSVLQGYTITVTKENLKRVADVVQEAVKE